jgi:uncharacterized protein with HEPN domain
VSRDELYLRHVLEAIKIIQGYAEAGEQAYLDDRMRQDAIVRRLEVIGEAVKQLSEGSRAAEPDIPWRRIAGMRDRLIHGYAGVDLEIVWRVVEDELPPLRTGAAAHARRGVAGSQGAAEHNARLRRATSALRSSSPWRLSRRARLEHPPSLAQPHRHLPIRPRRPRRLPEPAAKDRRQLVLPAPLRRLPAPRGPRAAHHVHRHLREDRLVGLAVDRHGRRPASVSRGRDRSKRSRSASPPVHHFDAGGTGAGRKARCDQRRGVAQHARSDIESNRAATVEASRVAGG